MTKLRSRLLIIPILAAVMLATVGSAMAGVHSSHDSCSGTSTPLSQPTVRPLSGEPDSGGLTTPQPKVTATWLAPVAAPWLLQLWIRMIVEQASNGSFHSKS